MTVLFFYAILDPKKPEIKLQTFNIDFEQFLDPKSEQTYCCFLS